MKNNERTIINLQNEIKDKRKFLEEFKSLGETGLLFFETITKIRYLESRAYELDELMA